MPGLRRDRDAEDTAVRYGVFPHAIERKPTGRGLVARKVNDDGTAWDSFNYGDLVPEIIYKTERGALGYIDRKRGAA